MKEGWMSLTESGNPCNDRNNPETLLSVNDKYGRIGLYG